MAPTLLLALQTAVAAASAAGAPAASDFDLAKAKQRQAGTDDRGAIVVIGRRPQEDRFTPEEMAELERRYAEKPVRAEMGIGDGATAGIAVSSATMPDGQVSKRVTIGTKIRF